MLSSHWIAGVDGRGGTPPETETKCNMNPPETETKCNMNPQEIDNVQSTVEQYVPTTTVAPTELILPRVKQ
jgi:hypothetical protein